MVSVQLSVAIGIPKRELKDERGAWWISQGDLNPEKGVESSIFVSCLAPQLPKNPEKGVESYPLFSFFRRERRRNPEKGVERSGGLATSRSPRVRIPKRELKAYLLTQFKHFTIRIPKRELKAF